MTMFTFDDIDITTIELEVLTRKEALKIFEAEA
jgi:hypothetical protein